MGIDKAAADQVTRVGSVTRRSERAAVRGGVSTRGSRGEPPAIAERVPLGGAPGVLREPVAFTSRGAPDPGASDSRMRGKLCSVTGCQKSAQPQMIGSAAFLFPEGRIVPEGTSPSTRTGRRPRVLSVGALKRAKVGTPRGHAMVVLLTPPYVVVRWASGVKHPETSARRSQTSESELPCATTLTS